MKRSDIAALIVVASISMFAAYFVADMVIGTPNSDVVTVKSANEITANIVDPDSSVFNDDAINPTVKVVIGDTKTKTDSKTDTK